MHNPDVRSEPLNVCTKRRLRLCLFQCKIFSDENIFEKGKYFLVFGCIVKIILENNFQCLVIFWKYYFPRNFSHFLAIFSTSKQILCHKTHHHTTQKPPKCHHPHHHNNNKKKISNQRDQADRRESDRWLSRLATIRPGLKGRGRSRKREIGGPNWELGTANSTARSHRCV